MLTFSVGEQTKNVALVVHRHRSIPCSSILRGCIDGKLHTHTQTRILTRKRQPHIEMKIKLFSKNHIHTERKVAVRMRSTQARRSKTAQTPWKEIMHTMSSSRAHKCDEYFIGGATSSQAIPWDLVCVYAITHYMQVHISMTATDDGEHLEHVERQTRPNLISPHK